MLHAIFCSILICGTLNVFVAANNLWEYFAVTIEGRMGYAEDNYENEKEKIYK